MSPVYCSPNAREDALSYARQRASYAPTEIRILDAEWTVVGAYLTATCPRPRLRRKGFSGSYKVPLHAAIAAAMSVCVNYQRRRIAPSSRALFEKESRCEAIGISSTSHFSAITGARAMCQFCLLRR